MKYYAVQCKDEPVKLVQVISTDIDTILKQVGIKDAEVVEISPEDIPEDRYFRNALELKDSKLDFNIKKAEELHLKAIRHKRNEALEALDKEQLRLQSLDTDIEELKKKKQVLRDIPQTLDLSKAKTIEDLKKTWPKELR